MPRSMRGLYNYYKCLLHARILYLFLNFFTNFFSFFFFHWVDFRIVELLGFEVCFYYCVVHIYMLMNHCVHVSMFRICFFFLFYQTIFTKKFYRLSCSCQKPDPLPLSSFATFFLYYLLLKRIIIK